jgi:glutamate formiminotransferase
VAVLESEIIGLTPQAALVSAAEHYLQLARFSSDQVLEKRLRD